MSLTARWLGRITYAGGLALQEQFHGAVVAARAQDIDPPEVLILLEHEPVYTIGRTPDQTSLRDETRLPHPVFRINRGGQATYHGPGQLMGYPILDLRRRGGDLHRYLRALETILIETLANYGVAAHGREGLTGVWVGPRKIASLGVGIRQWVSMHGFALNICGDLSPFQHITPCGIAGVEMTSIERETGRPVTVREVSEVLAPIFCARFGADGLLARGSVGESRQEL
jgi:lipoyl(octanoyl) transferase